jgi:hypothetical protein
MVSPTTRMPEPLYGSGGLICRRFDAICVTWFLSTPYKQKVVWSKMNAFTCRVSSEYITCNVAYCQDNVNLLLPLKMTAVIQKKQLPSAGCSQNVPKLLVSNMGPLSSQRTCQKRQFNTPISCNPPYIIPGAMWRLHPSLALKSFTEPADT